MKQGFYNNGLPVCAENVPDLGLLPDGVNSILNDLFVYVDADDGAHIASPGLETDGGTIPRMFWRMIGSPWRGKRRYAFIIHDQECQDVYKLPKHMRDGARLRADKNLYEMCLFLGDSKAEAWAIYCGVRLGWNCWQKYKKGTK